MFALAWWSLCHLTGSEIRSICLSIPHDRIVVVAHSWCLSGDIGAVERRQTQRYRSRGAMLTCVWSQREVERDLPFGILHPLSMTYILPSPYLNICYLFSPQSRLSLLYSPKYRGLALIYKIGNLIELAGTLFWGKLLIRNCRVGHPL